MTYAPEITLFGILVMVYNIFVDEDKFLYENFGFRRPHFHANTQLKIETTEFFL